MNDILNRQTALPGEFDETYGLPSDGKENRRQFAPFLNVGKKRLTRQSVMYSYSIFADVVPQKLIGSNQGRVYLAIQNLGPNTLYCGFGNTPNVNGNNSLVIPAGFGFTFEDGICPNNEVICVSVGCQVTVIEGVDATPNTKQV